MRETTGQEVKKYTDLKGYEFDDVARSEIMKTKRRDHVTQLWHITSGEMPYEPYFPLVNVNADKIQVDVDASDRGGMTPAVARGSDTPIYGSRGRAEYEIEPAEFREKLRLVEQDLVDLRNIGTESELVTMEQEMMRRRSAIIMRQRRRLEWMRKEVLFDNQVELRYRDGKTRTIQYEHPDYLKPTAGTLWTAATSDPLDDLQLWVELLEDSSDFMAEQIMLPRGCTRLAIQNDRFKDFAIYGGVGAYRQGAAAGVHQVMSDYLGGVRVMENKTRFRITTHLTAGAAAGAVNLSVADTTYMEVGMKVQIRSLTTRLSDQVTITNVNPGVSIDVTATNLDFAANDGISFRVDLQPRDKILILGQAGLQLDMENQAPAASDRTLVDNWGQMTSTLSRYNDLGNPAPGPFTKLIDRMKDDPPAVEEVHGIRALPVLFHPDAFLVATFR